MPNVQIYKYRTLTLTFSSRNRTEAEKSIQYPNKPIDCITDNSIIAEHFF